MSPPAEESAASVTASRTWAPMGNRLYMAASIFIRMGISLGVFVILARTLGPVDFGFVSAVLIYAGLAGLIADFGFGLRTLRDIAANPAEGGQILAAALSVKAALTVVVMLVGLVALGFLAVTTTMKISAALLAAALLIGSFGDLTLVAYRSLGRYSGETWIVAWTSTIYAGIITPIAFFHLGLVALGVGFLASRVIYAGVAMVGAQRLFPNQKLRLSGFRATLQSMRQSLSWALDSGFLYIAGQIDGLVIVQILGFAAAGIYQSGARFVQAALAMVAVLSNIHMPALAARQSPGTLSGAERRMMVEFMALGTVLGVSFLFGGPLITRFLLGAKYEEVNQLWPGFAAFVIARYAAAAWGASLAAFGKPLLRVSGQFVGLLVIIGGFFLFLPRFGVVASPWIMASGGAVTFVVYGIGRVQLLRRRGR